MKRVSLLIVFLFALNLTEVQSQDDPLKVVASTSIIADVAAQVGGDMVEVSTLIPRGADAHSFALSPRDVLAITQADWVLVNGMGLEAGLLDTITANAGHPPLVVSLGIRILSGLPDQADAGVLGVLGKDLDCGDPLISLPEATPASEDAQNENQGEIHDHSPCDPHVWTDVANVMIWTQNIAQAFVEADPAHAENYMANAAAYQDELTALDTELRDLIDPLPQEKRVLVTNHEFLGYFAAAYNFTIIGAIIPGVSSAAETNPQELARLVKLIQDAHIPAVFAETTDNTRLADALAGEVGHVQVVELYSESLSEPEGSAATYLDYMRYNVMAIVTALQD